MTLRRLDHTFFDEERRPMLGSLLVQKGLLTWEQLDAALEESRRTGERLGDALVRLGFVFESDLARTLAAQANVEYVDLTVRGHDASLAPMLPAEVAARHRAVPIRRLADGAVLIGVDDPLDDHSELGAFLGGAYRLAACDPSGVRAALRRAYAVG